MTSNPALNAHYEAYSHCVEHLQDELGYVGLLMGNPDWGGLKPASRPSARRADPSQNREPEPAGKRDLAACRYRLDKRIRRTLDSGLFLPLAHLTEVLQLSDLERSLLLCVAGPYLEENCRTANASGETTLHALIGRLGHRSEDRNQLAQALHLSRPLVRWRLIRTLDAADRTPRPDDSLVPDPAVIHFLSGNDPLAGGEPWLSRLEPGTAEPDAPDPERCEMIRNLADHLGSQPETGSAAIHLRGPDRNGKRTAALQLASRLGFQVLFLDLGQGPEKAEDRDRFLGERLRLAIRTALMVNGFLYVGGLDAGASNLQSTLPLRYRQILAESLWVCFFDWEGLETNPPQGSWRHRYILDFPVPRLAERERLWRRSLAEWKMDEALAPKLAAGYPLCRHQIERAAAQARDQATLLGKAASTIEIADLAQACRMQVRHDLGELAVKVPAVHDWGDLVVDEATREHLQEIAAFHRFGPRVYQEWGFGKKMASGRGIGALFSGPSGTGKTMAASLIAANLSLELFKIDLANLVSKYIGETEKNLARVFKEAEQAGAMLFFDEADALFGKRTEVRDAHDRYANLEVSYLLQRIEDYAGIIVLATNLLTNMDNAFLRRMRFIVEMPFPDREMRQRIWQVHLPEQAPLAQDVDLAFLAEKIEVTGGHIRNIVLAGAMLAASRDESIGMPHFLAATKREYQKLGRTFIKTDFEPYSANLG